MSQSLKSFTCQDYGVSVMPPVKATQLYACTDRGDTRCHSTDSELVGNPA